MGKHVGTTLRSCWCGNTELPGYSAEYAVCTKCGTLVSQAGLSADQLRVKDDASDFYGKEYWLSHMREDLGFPDIAVRARQDLPERCAYWLRSLLNYRQPPASLLELGCAHGGFVALARQLGFDASGLELSPWVAQFARKTFDIPVLQGPVENQNIPPGSLDIIMLNDVLEHLPDPIGTMNHCGKLLKEDGLLVVQTPDFPESKTYEEMTAESNTFLEHVNGKANEHLYLFSQRAVRRLFDRLGFAHMRFERPMFGYDSYTMISRRPLIRTSDEQVDSQLKDSPNGLLFRALFDLQKAWRSSEDDRATRLVMIHKLNALLKASEADVAARMHEIRHLTQDLASSEADRAARLVVIERLGGQLAVSETDRSARLDMIHRLNVMLASAQGHADALRVAVDATGAEAVNRMAAQLAAKQAQLEEVERNSSIRHRLKRLPAKVRRLFGKLNPVK